MFLIALVWVGCVTDREVMRALDQDADGFAVGPEDCDDDDASVNRGAPERCDDGIDNDCDGEIDDFGEGETVWFLDEDGDGYGVAASFRRACSTWADAADEGWAIELGDCDDSDDTVWPDAPELCDGIDNDCDRTIDEGAC